MIFVNYKQAYYSVIRERVWKILKNFGISTKLINMIQLCNTKNSNRVKVNNEISHYFIINNGLKKGDTMSPVFFNMTLESVIRKMSQTNTLHLDEGNILLEYAVFIEKSPEGIPITVEELNT